MTKRLTVLLSAQQLYRHIHWKRIAVLVFACWPFFSLADEVTVTKVGHWGSGPYEDVVVAGNYAYAAAGSTGIDIIDISNPASPTLVSQYDTDGYARRVFVDGNFAYVADGRHGLQIIDISNKASPTRVGGYDTPGLAFGVFVDGNFAYVADYAGLQIIDISNKASPTRVGGYDTSGRAEGVFVDGNFAYVADGRHVHPSIPFCKLVEH
ncbi:LVIVD repeat protein [Candidatus Thiomargarita nelsonii]|uniref:LVIVD repeat protein n=1 Tax=Candidatus Thiomargarita nelsonii TaxID=1003181 RepID=A0A0A6NYV0_9GAMM|nr:LVIVD repeat protein [Candidatus Thiomargarita nelsonii]